MGDYIELSDIEARIQGFSFSATSEPSSTEGTSFITAIEAEMNAALKRLGFTVPITQAASPKSYAQLKDIAAWGAAWLTLEAINALTSGEEDTRAARWKKTYEDRMSAIVRDGGDLLYDAVRDTSDDLTNTAPVVADPTPIEGRMTFGQLTRKRHKRNAWTTRYWPG